MIPAPDEAGLSPGRNPKTAISIVRYGPPAIPPQVWRPTLSGGSPLPFENLSDHFIIRMYENIRDEARADVTSGVRLLGEPARERAERLKQEIERRGLFCTPIDWPTEI